MNATNIQNCFSQERLSTYAKLSKSQDLDEALVLYRLNLEISATIYPLISALEITFRNRIHRGFSEIYGDEWPWNGSIAFMPFEKEAVLKANGKIADLHFGFWTALLSPKYSEEYFSKISKSVFPNAHHISHKVIRIKFHDIRKLRNRLFHFEPVINLRNPDLISQIRDFKRCLCWMSEDVYEWLIENFDDIKSFEQTHENLRNL